MRNRLKVITTLVLFILSTLALKFHPAFLLLAIGLLSTIYHMLHKPATPSLKRGKTKWHRIVPTRN